MLRNYALLLLCNLCFVLHTHGQEAVVSLRLPDTAEQYRFEVFEPLEGAYNGNLKTQELRIQGGGSGMGDCSVALKKPGFVRFKCNARSFYVLLFPGDRLRVNVYPNKDITDWVTFSGTNAAGQQLINTFYYRPFQYLSTTPLFDSLGRHYDLINPAVLSIASARAATIDSLVHNGALKPGFAALLRQNTNAYIFADAVDKYLTILRGRKYGRLSKPDSILIRNNIRALFAIASPVAQNTEATIEGEYYAMKYLNSGFAPSTAGDTITVFGPYNNYGRLPDTLQKNLLAGSIISSYISSFDEFDKTAARNYFRTKYPNSRYNGIFSKLEAQYNPDDKVLIELSNLIHIDTSARSNSVRNLKELHTAFFKDRKIFIDLWATWCMPCIEQFGYRETLDSLAAKNNITVVYISIDEPRLSHKWAKDVFRFGLKGFHFRAGAALKNDIQQTIYGKESFTIPRYILINEKGEILSKDAPRPGDAKAIAALFQQTVQESSPK
ncbi:TlpA family protein disulfide reductase [Chitinophaga barathri]|nr:redoxin family protein [Chitinophaga barathri]